MIPSLKHVIVEGMDGSGKDTLIGQLMEVFGSRFQIHPRASTSLGGPVEDLAAWVSEDVNTMHMQPPSIYNRHPLISEKIYYRYRQPPGYRSPEFGNRTWFYAMQRWASRQAVLVRCRPPYHVVRDTVHTQGRDAHMPGVYDNLLGIYTDYVTYRWPGILIDYDYTSHDSPTALAGKILGAFQHNARKR